MYSNDISFNPHNLKLPASSAPKKKKKELEEMTYIDPSALSPCNDSSHENLTITTIF